MMYIMMDLDNLTDAIIDEKGNVIEQIVYKNKNQYFTASWDWIVNEYGFAVVDHEEVPLKGVFKKFSKNCNIYKLERL